MDKIMNASYGIADQREANKKQADRQAAARIEQEYRMRQPSSRQQEHPPPPRQLSQPYGGHAAPSRMAKVEIRPGVFHHVEVGGKGGNAAGQNRGRPSSAPVRGRPGEGPQGAKPYQVDALALAPVLVKVEEQMRDQLKRRSALHLTEKVLLLRAFGKVFGKKHIDITSVDKVSIEQFVAAWKQFSISIPNQVVYGLFNKYGQDRTGRMAVMNFVDALLSGAPRQLMLENNTVQRGAFKAGEKATHTGKIQYPQSKKGVWPPSNWDGSLADSSARLPQISLELEFVYGYDGSQATAPNIFYTRTGDVVYNAAGVAVVYNKETHTQKFFLGHDDDLLSLCIHPDRSIVATGQAGKDPAVIVWDSSTCTQLVKIHQGYGNRGVTALCFSPDGSMLACVCMDNKHTLYIWDWRKKKLLMEQNTAQGAPPSTYGVVWSPFETDRLVAYGQNFIKCYTLSADPKLPGALIAKTASGVFSNIKTHSTYSAVFLPSGILLTGSQSGSICSWKGNRLLKENSAHATGPLRQRRDGSKQHGGVRCLLLQSNGMLISGGSDGYVIKWDVSRGDLGPPLQRLPLLRPEQMGTMLPPALRGLDAFPGSDVLIAGTASCDVWEVDGTPEILIYGQRGDVNGLAMNQAYPHVFMTVCESDEVIVYSATTRKPIRVLQIAGNGDQARSAAFSPDGQHLAVGMFSGGLKVMDFYPNVRQVVWCKESSESIDEMKYSPCGKWLAIGSHDQFIYILDVRGGYKLHTKVSGHSSTITHIDWSVDSSVIQSNDQAYEILYSDPRTGRQVKENQRDTKWATWTCTLGFDVMGIWPPDSDGTDVNACDRSPSMKYLITADDFGKIKVFNYPVVIHHAPSLEYPGHCSHVPNVRWAADESFAISVGGHDRTTFQWRVRSHASQGQGQGRGQGQPQAPGQQAYNYQAMGKDGVVWGDPSVLAAHQQEVDQKLHVAQRMAAAAPPQPGAQRASAARARPASASRVPVRR